MRGINPVALVLVAGAILSLAPACAGAQQCGHKLLRQKLSCAPIAAAAMRLRIVS